MSGFDPRVAANRSAPPVEVINGAGGRRHWSTDDKARILEETLAPGAVVSDVARRHGLRPQQVFRWRREARIDPAEAAKVAVSFVPAVIESPPPEPSATTALVKPAARRRDPAVRAHDGIELEIGGAVVRIRSGASPKAIAAVIGALKAGL